MKTKHKILHARKIIFIFSCFVLFACKTTEKNQGSNLEEPSLDEEKLTLLFAGDIMAHRENFSMKDFSLIWKDVKPEIQNADFSFANIESPVMDERKWESYPTFNMHSDYVEEAINAGFNVFSLANNHSNDQGKEGIIETKKTFTNLKEKHEKTERPIYFSGIKDVPGQKEFDYTVFYKNEFKILFLAATELLNQPSYKSYLNYVSPEKKGYENLKESIKKLSENEEPDLFVLSFHSAEEEYVSKVSESRKKLYNEFLMCGADIVWANHPHVIREYEIVKNKKTGDTEKMIFYGNGNTISGQRRNPNFKNPENARDYTGDGLMFLVRIEKSHADSNDEKGIFITETKPCFITTFIDENKNFILKKLDDDFIKSLENEKNKDIKKYFSRRKEISESVKETTIWQ